MNAARKMNGISASGTIAAIQAKSVASLSRAAAPTASVASSAIISAMPAR